MTDETNAIARIDAMITMAEARRNNALRELDRHRATLGRTMRAVIDQIEDAQAELIE